MVIPEKYRERYDRLALSHPWMREMRDTDGMPEGDVVKLLRDEHWGPIGRVIADMVERDYVSRQDFAAQHRTLCAVREQRDRESESNRSYARVISKLKAERDEALEIRDKACGDAATLKAERDELTAKLSDLNAEYYDAACAKDAEIRRLERERDEWRAKAEAKSAKRAAAVERLRDYERWSGGVEDTSLTKAVIGAESWGCTWQENRDALIDLLTDDDALLVPSTSPNGTANGTANRTCPNGNGTASNDSREKLEADALNFANGFIRNHNGAISWNDELYRGIIDLLDRQAAITKRECEDTFLDRADEIITRRELEKRELQAEVEQWKGAAGTAHEMWEKAVTERDEIQRELGYYVAAYRRAARERDGLARDLADAMDRGLA